MTVEFSHTADDIVEAGSWRERASDQPLRSRLEKLWRPVVGGEPSARSADGLRAWSGLLMLAGGALTVAASAYLGVRLSPWWLIVTALLLVAGVSLFVGVSRARSARTLRRQFDADPANASPARFDFDEAGFGFIADMWHCRVDWPAVTSFRETPNLFLLIDDEPNTFILPKRAFADEAAREDFRTFVRRLVGPLSGQA